MLCIKYKTHALSYFVSRLPYVRQIKSRTWHTRTDAREDYAEQDPGEPDRGPGSREKQHPSPLLKSKTVYESSGLSLSHLFTSDRLEDGEGRTGPNKDERDSSSVFGSLSQSMISRCSCGTQLKIEERDCEEEEEEHLR